MMQMHFINGTPEVEGNRMRVELEVNESTADLLCELLTQERLDSPMVANCEQKCFIQSCMCLCLYQWWYWSVSVCLSVCLSVGLSLYNVIYVHYVNGCL